MGCWYSALLIIIPLDFLFLSEIKISYFLQAKSVIWSKETINMANASKGVA